MSQANGVNLDVGFKLTAFNEATIGTKVVDREGLITALIPAIKSHDPSADRAPGQYYIKMPDGVLPMVSAGVGKRSSKLSDYHLREFSGQVTAFLRREKAEPATRVDVIIYTREAYLANREVAKCKKEVERVADGEARDATHFVVAVLAYAGPPSTLTPYRFVSNLAGNNHEAKLWGVDEIRAKAKGIKKYNDKWRVVSD